jgi:hypothetical protein
LVAIAVGATGALTVARGVIGSVLGSGSTLCSDGAPRLPVSPAESKVSCCV